MYTHSSCASNKWVVNLWWSEYGGLEVQTLLQSLRQIGKHVYIHEQINKMQNTVTNNTNREGNDPTWWSWWWSNDVLSVLWKTYELIHQPEDWVLVVHIQKGKVSGRHLISGSPGCGDVIQKDSCDECVTSVWSVTGFTPLEQHHVQQPSELSLWPHRSYFGDRLMFVFVFK